MEIRSISGFVLLIVTFSFRGEDLQGGVEGGGGNFHSYPLEAVACMITSIMYFYSSFHKICESVTDTCKSVDREISVLMY